MADLREVLDAVRDAAAAVLYPGGVPPGPAPLSVVGSPVRLFVGWPDASLEADLKAGICQVSVWPRGGVSRNVPPYLDGWRPDPQPAPSMSATVGDQIVTFTGTADVPVMIAAVIVDRVPYTYPLSAGDTPETVAVALATQIGQDRPAFIAGPMLQVPNAASIVARVAAGGIERREVRRQVQGVQITAWCPTPTLRDAVSAILDAAFADDLRSLALPDRSIARISYDGTTFDEEARAQPLHRRDLLLSVEYATTQQRTAPPVVVPTGSIATPSPAGTDTPLVQRVIIV